VIKSIKTIQNEDELKRVIATPPKGVRIILRYLMTPVKLSGEECKIRSVEFAKNRLEV
jgi:hypothetical protein